MRSMRCSRTPRCRRSSVARIWPDSARATAFLGSLEGEPGTAPTNVYTMGVPGPVGLDPPPAPPVRAPHLFVPRLKPDARTADAGGGPVRPGQKLPRNSEKI